MASLPPIGSIDRKSDIPVLITNRLSPHAIRARMALFVSGVTVELREVDLPARYIIESPKSMQAAGKITPVPQFILPDNSRINDSLSIMRWALGQADPKDWSGSDFALSRQQSEWMQRHEQEFILPVCHYRNPENYGIPDGLSYRRLGIGFLEKLNAQLEGKAYIFGDKMMMVDAAMLPFIRIFAQVDTQWWYAAPNLEHVRNWLSNMIKTVEFKEVMDTMKPWRHGFARALYGNQE